MLDRPLAAAAAATAVDAGFGAKMRERGDGTRRRDG